jgi:hypothetical protein
MTIEKELINCLYESDINYFAVLVARAFNACILEDDKNYNKDYNISKCVRELYLISNQFVFTFNEDAAFLIRGYLNIPKYISKFDIEIKKALKEVDKLELLK